MTELTKNQTLKLIGLSCGVIGLFIMYPFTVSDFIGAVLFAFGFGCWRGESDD